MDDFLDQFDRVPTSQKVLLLLLVLAGVFVAFYLLVYSPMDQDITTNNSSIQTQNTEIARLQAEQGNVEEIRQAISELCARKANFEEALPLQSDIPDLLESVTEFAQLANLEIQLFQPQPNTPTAEGYTAVPVDMVVSGTYDDLLNFFHFIGTQSRIINVQSVNMQVGRANAVPDPSLTFASELKVSAPPQLTVETHIVTYFSGGGSGGSTICDGQEG